MKKYLKSGNLKSAITKKKSGYILVLTLFMIAMSITLLTSILQKTLNFQKQITFNLNREKARTLALGAIDLAASQVSFKQKTEPKVDSVKGDSANKDTDKDHKQDTNFEKEWFKKLAPIINKWQTIKLNDDDIAATISLYITCQQGKLDLNYIQKQAGQQNKQEDKKDQQTQAESKTKTDTGNIQTPPDDKNNKPENLQQSQKNEDKIDEKQENKNFIQAINGLIEKSLKINILNSIKELENVTSRDIESPLDFLKLEQFAKIKQNIFVDLDNKEDIYLMDLFSANSTTPKARSNPTLLQLLSGKQETEFKINPWLLSKSLGKLLELKTEQINMEDLISKFNNNVNWQKDWDNIFAPIYGKSFNSIDKEISNLFSKDFDPKAFSVVIYINLEKSSQRLFAILKKDNLNQDKDSNSAIFKVAKIYWF